jgi:hypothetical protein
MKKQTAEKINPIYLIWVGVALKTALANHDKVLAGQLRHRIKEIKKALSLQKRNRG